MTRWSPRTPRSARHAATIIFVGASAVSREGLADGLAVRRSGATDCPDAAELSKQVRVLTPKGPDPLDGTASGTDAISVDFGRRGPRLRAVIRATGEKSGSRVLDDDGPSCGPLAEATALAIAILVDPDAAVTLAGKESTARGAEPAKTIEPAVEPVPESAAQRPRVPEEAKTRAAGWGVSIDAGAGIVTGVNASVAPVFLAAITVRPVAQLSFEASALMALPRSHDLDRGTVDVSAAGGGASACVWPIARAGRVSIDLGGCLGGIIAAVRGTGSGYDADRSASRPWGAFDAHFAARGDLFGPLGWGVRGGAAVPFHRESFGVAGAGTAYEMASIGVASLVVVTTKIR